ncbi:MAG: ribbon-helix-helix protein, CopG family [Mobilicoccus sp.]|nr:ribbon-helix-helix protein, CopG family [Mobilicoccus sp.]
MTTQITVRLDDDLVAFVDSQVGRGQARSRAALIERSLRREQRRMAAERDAEIYAAMRDEDDDLADFAAATAARLDLADLD